MDEYLQAPALAPYKLLLTRILRFKPHTFSDKEEKLLATQTEMAQAAEHIFRQLNDTDIKFGTVKNEKGQPIELSHATFSMLLYCPIATSAPTRSTPTINSTRPTNIRWRPRWALRSSATCTIPRPQLSLGAGSGLVSRPGARGV